MFLTRLTDAAHRHLPPGSLRAELVTGASGSLVIKGTQAGLMFLSSVLLARFLGPAGYGTYAYAMAIVQILAIAAALGLPQIVVRDVAAYQALQKWTLLRGLLRFAVGAVLAASLGLALIAGIVGWRVAGSALFATLSVALVLLPIQSLLPLIMAALQGLRHILTAQIPSMIVQPGLFLGLAVLGYMLPGPRFDAPWAMAAQLGGGAVALMLGAAALRKRLPRAVKEAAPVSEAQAWIKSALPLLFAGQMAIVNQRTDIVLLGALKGAEAVGIYRPACSVVTLVGFGLGSVNVALAPVIASLHAKGDLARLQRVVTASARAATAFAVPVTAGLIFGGRWILLVFGRQYARGATALAILSLGQLANALAGSVGLILTMTGHERDTAKGLAAAAVINVLLNLALIPSFGIEGAAAATATSLAAWNALLMLFVWKRLRLRTTAFARIRVSVDR